MRTGQYGRETQSSVQDPGYWILCVCKLLPRSIHRTILIDDSPCVNIYNLGWNHAQSTKTLLFTSDELINIESPDMIVYS